MGFSFIPQTVPLSLMSARLQHRGPNSFQSPQFYEHHLDKTHKQLISSARSLKKTLPLTAFFGAAFGAFAGGTSLLIVSALKKKTLNPVKVLCGLLISSAMGLSVVAVPLHFGLSHHHQRLIEQKNQLLQNLTSAVRIQKS